MRKHARAGRGDSFDDLTGALAVKLAVKLVVSISADLAR